MSEITRKVDYTKAKPNNVFSRITSLALWKVNTKKCLSMVSKSLSHEMKVGIIVPCCEIKPRIVKSYE